MLHQRIGIFTGAAVAFARSAEPAKQTERDWPDARHDGEGGASRPDAVAGATRRRRRHRERHSCSPPWSAPASWRRSSLVETARSRCLCNTLPTGAILAVLILIFGPLSGAHFNPAVSVAFALAPRAAVAMAAFTSQRKSLAR